MLFILRSITVVVYVVESCYYLCLLFITEKGSNICKKQMPNFAIKSGAFSQHYHFVLTGDRKRVLLWSAS